MVEPPEELPLTVAVSRSTASAAEVLAGVLKGNCNASFDGHPTFGKGLIQSVYELSDSSGAIVAVRSSESLKVSILFSSDV